MITYTSYDLSIRANQVGLHLPTHSGKDIEYCSKNIHFTPIRNLDEISQPFLLRAKPHLLYLVSGPVTGTSTYLSTKFHDFALVILLATAAVYHRWAYWWFWWFSQDFHQQPPLAVRLILISWSSNRALAWQKTKRWLQRRSTDLALFLFTLIAVWHALMVHMRASYNTAVMRLACYQHEIGNSLSNLSSDGRNRSQKSENRESCQSVCQRISTTFTEISHSDPFLLLV